VSFSYKDQGWGNRKGRLYLRPRASTSESYGDFKGSESGSGDRDDYPERYEYVTPIAAHVWKEGGFSIRGDGRGDGEKILGLWVGIGGGGGHEFKVKDFNVEIVTADSV